ncbi:MAG: glycerophosphodiester phosphodiesterase [Candidatus Omnitrophica bacterium]|nr:glycerophosphodiester phosphodiesterase [Candidatus Omnitrophota bacterium]MCG2703183.1 glycerophosphodiester phosphodiesterase [Candidatus Omnitrophota bacterium]
MRKPLIIAHRGARGNKPENTLESFQEAVRLAADFVELDVQKSADEKIVVLHDYHWKNCCRVSDTPYLRIKNAGLKRKIKIPLLEEVLEALDNRIGIDIEIKSMDRDILTLLVRALKGHNKRKIIVSSFIHRHLVELKELLPSLRLGALMSCRPIDPLPILKAARTDLLIQHAEFVDEEYVHLLHRNKKQIFVWTVNDTEDLRRMARCGVDGIVSDFPDRARAAVEETALL